MKKFILGLIIGLLLGGSLVWAAGRITLEDGRGAEIGTTANPLVISIQ